MNTVLEACLGSKDHSKWLTFSSAKGIGETKVENTQGVLCVFKGKSPDYGSTGNTKICHIFNQYNIYFPL